MNAFEQLKNNDRTNALDWLREIPFITYGYVERVINESTVVVVPVVQDQDTFTQEVTVTLLSLSSASFELQITPQQYDLVLLFSLDKVNGGMFNRPGIRKKRLEEEAEENESEDEEAEEDAEIVPTLPEEERVGYTLSSMVGILVSTIKSASVVQTAITGTGKESSCTTSYLAALVRHIYSGSVDEVYENEDGDAQLVSTTYAETHPQKTDYRSSSAQRHGFLFSFEDEIEVPVPAPVLREYSAEAPVTEHFGAKVERTYGVTTYLEAEEGKLKDEGEPEDTEGPVTEYFSETAPYELKRAGTTTNRYGYNADGDPTAGTVEEYFSEDTTVTRTYEANVTENYTDDAAVERTYGNTVDQTFKKKVTHNYDDDLELLSKGAFKAEFDGDLSLTFKKAISSETMDDINLQSTAAGLVTIGNAVATLGAMIDEFLDIVTALDTVGSPAAQNTGPVAKGKLAVLKAKWGQVFK